MFMSPIFITISVLLAALITAAPLWGAETSTGVRTEAGGRPEAKWGIGFGFRTAVNPFAEGDSMLEDVYPLLYYDSSIFYLDGLEAGLKVLNRNNWKLNLLARWRIIDVPEEYDDKLDIDVLDWGLGFRYQPERNPAYFQVDLLADERQRLSSILRAGHEGTSGRLDWDSYLSLRVKDSRFNDYYYGLAENDVGSGTDLTAGLGGYYYLGNNLYLRGALALTWLDSSARSSAFVDEDLQGNLSLGLVYRNYRQKNLKPQLDAKPYLRLAHGWATPSDLQDIITFKRRKDDHHNQLTSIFYGHPLSDTLLGLPLATYLTPGLVWHWQSDVQESGQEFVLAIKSYYTFAWPAEWRLGFGTGFSYAANVPYIEQVEMAKKGYEDSKWLLYLDFSLDLNLGKLFRVDMLDDIWLGYSVHHRSGIFGSSSMFSRISGGSNYNTIALQYHF